MSEHNKDNHNFEFIKEQVIVKKHKKIKKWLLPFLMTIIMAILFGIIAAVTFCIAEPKLYRFLHKDQKEKTPITFPTTYPDETEEETKVEAKEESSDNTQDDLDPGNGQVEEGMQEPEQVIVEQSIDADIEDYKSMYDDIKSIAYNSGKSIVKLCSIINEKDWFGNPVEREIKTTGLVIGNNSRELLILVSFDRVEDASSIKILFSETITASALLQDYERELNLAIIAVSLEDIPEIYLNSIKNATLGESYSITIGSPVIALGSPNGHPGSIDVGIVTSRGSSISITDNRLDLFNTDITDNAKSDGVIINLNGEVIGIITRTLKDDLNKELSTAIGISKVKAIIQRMANQEPRVYFGVISNDMTEVAKLEHKVENGIYVDVVKANSPAFKSGIKNGDIIIEVNGQPVVSTNRFYNIISEYQPGQLIDVKIKRTSSSTEKELNLSVTLEAKVEEE